MPIDQNDILPLTRAASNLITAVSKAIDKDSPRGRRLTKGELLEVLAACGKLIAVVAKELAD